MELDAEGLIDGARLEADLCIVGAGPAGIAMAREYIPHGINVLLLESGGPTAEDWAQTLNEGTVIGGPYAGLRATRHRQPGGAAHLWNTPVAGDDGAKYVPLDRSDLDAWPLRWSEIEPYYQRAQQVSGLGPFHYDGAEWADLKRPVLDIAGGHLTTGVYQFGPGGLFRERRLAEIRAAANVRLCHHATVCELRSTGGVTQVTDARIRCRTGREITARARVFVLAAGAIENARLLLTSNLGNRHDWVGRCFMEHPRDQALTLVPSAGLFPRLGFYDPHVASTGTIVGGRLAPTESAIRDLGLPNFSVTLLPRLSNRPPSRGWSGRLIRRMRAIVAPPPSPGYGWSRWSEPPKEFEGFRLLVNLEQRPNPKNRLVLGGGTDLLGMPRVELQWRWRPEEQEELTRLRTLLASWLEDGGLGKVRVDADQRPDPNAHHHAGTTRMDREESNGVVDPDGRVHGVENLYVTGASVFPTAGFANPTLTIVALALKLADHLRGRFVPGS